MPRIAIHEEVTTKDSCFVVGGREIPYLDSMKALSPCFGGPFLVWHPYKHAELLASKMKQHGARVWLVYESGVNAEITAAGPA